jgi:formamidopyrimidine-DNA glycosylase
MLEIERYRQAAEAVVGRTIETVDAPDAWYLKRGTTARGLVDALQGRRVISVRRRGKLLLLDTDGPVLGLRFGMTGRLVVDELAPIDRLEYGSRRDEPAWDRLRLGFRDGGALRINDARRLGGAELDPDEERLGVDASTITPRDFATMLAGSTVAVKARLMDQRQMAGVGNLLADEILWRAGIDPARPSNALSPAEVRRLHRSLRRVLDELHARGGSHTGDLQEARHRGGLCPKDGTPLDRRTIGGRTTYSCPHHQR